MPIGSGFLSMIYDLISGLISGNAWKVDATSLESAEYQADLNKRNIVNVITTKTATNSDTAAADVTVTFGPYDMSYMDVAAYTIHTPGDYDIDVTVTDEVGTIETKSATGGSPINIHTDSLRPIEAITFSITVKQVAASGSEDVTLGLRRQP